MKRKGEWSALGTLLVMALVLVVIFGIGPRIYSGAKNLFSFFGVASDGETGPTQESAANVAFEGFTNAYQSCKSYQVNDCLCDQFGTNELPDGYSIRLESLSDSKTRIELYGSKPTPESIKLLDNDNLCFYIYDKSTTSFSLGSPKNIVIDAKNPYEYKIDNKIQLIKSNTGLVCFVSGTSEREQFNEITRRKNNCNLKSEGTASQKIGMLDLSDYTGDYSQTSFVQSQTEKASAVLSTLRTILIDNIGQTTTITLPTSSAKGRYERRLNMFNDAYKNFDSNKDGKISDNVYFISVRGLQLQQKDSGIKKDYFKVHYLKGSAESKNFAEKIASKLRELDGKLIYGVRELNQAEADEKYRFIVDVIEEQNSQDSQGPVFLTCTGDYKDFPACKENYYLPAVFVDIVEVNGDGHYMFEGHLDIIAAKIHEGVRGYLQK